MPKIVRHSRLKRLYLCALFAFGGSACSSQADKQTLEQFRTLITPSGVKRFELPLPRPDFSVNLSRTRNEQQRNPYRDELSEKKIQRRVEAVIAATEYCRKGFILLGRHAGETAQKIRGECSEPATPKDRKRFKNTITQW